MPRPHALIKYRHVDCPEVSWLPAEKGGAGDYRPDERPIMLRTIVYPN